MKQMKLSTRSLPKLVAYSQLNFLLKSRSVIGLFAAAMYGLWNLPAFAVDVVASKQKAKQWKWRFSCRQGTVARQDSRRRNHDHYVVLSNVYNPNLKASEAIRRHAFPKSGDLCDFHVELSFRVAVMGRWIVNLIRRGVRHDGESSGCRTLTDAVFKRGLWTVHSL